MTQTCVTIKKPTHFSLDQTFDCGQCFRFSPENGVWGGMVRGQYITLKDLGDELAVGMDGGTTADLAEGGRLYDFLDLGRDYGVYREKILSRCPARARDLMLRAIDSADGIRILRQDPWETLISFLLSQNNNIPRIKKLIDTVCRRYGERHGDRYAFPGPKALLSAGVAELYDCKMGFRANYVYDAACRVAAGQIDLERMRDLPSEECMRQLQTIRGVGPKVACCVLLFAYARFEIMPVDVWMARVFEESFGGKTPDFADANGIAQQYLFYYRRTVCRNNGLELPGQAHRKEAK